MLSAYLNIGLISPMEVVEQVLSFSAEIILQLITQRELLDRSLVGENLFA